jgi:hypothetical protein
MYRTGWTLGDRYLLLGIDEVFRG